jgi:hypothetical protein
MIAKVIAFRGMACDADNRTFQQVCHDVLRVKNHRGPGSHPAALDGKLEQAIRDVCDITSARTPRAHAAADGLPKPMRSPHETQTAQRTGRHP